MRGIVARGHVALKPNTVFVGVDLGLDSNAATVVTERGQRLARFRFASDESGYGYLRHRLHRMLDQQHSESVLVGMEPTNYFWRLLVTDLEDHKIPYALVNAYTVSRRREGDHLDPSKTDELDADVVADLVRTGKYTEVQMLHGAYAELRNYVTLIDQLGRRAASEKNMIRSALGQLFPELPTIFADWGLTMQAMIRNHAAAVQIRAMSADDFIAAVRADFQGQRLMGSKLRQVHALASHSIGLREGVEALQMTVRTHLDAWTLCCEQLIAAEEALLETFYATREAPYLLSLPFLGAKTAATILAEIGDPQAYRRVGQWIKLAGTQPAPKTSGRKTRSLTPMSRKGRARLRQVLFMACLRLIQGDESFAKRYQELQERDKNPLVKMQAIGVLMNKLLRILWALMRQQVYYDPTWAQSS
jgi:transposase